MKVVCIQVLLESLKIDYEFAVFLLKLIDLVNVLLRFFGLEFDNSIFEGEAAIFEDKLAPHLLAFLFLGFNV